MRIMTIYHCESKLFEKEKMQTQHVILSDYLFYCHSE
jgi:hypothetical protein